MIIKQSKKELLRDLQQILNERDRAYASNIELGILLEARNDEIARLEARIKELEGEDNN